MSWLEIIGWGCICGFVIAPLAERLRVRSRLAYGLVLGALVLAMLLHVLNGGARAEQLASLHPPGADISAPATPRKAVVFRSLPTMPASGVLLPKPLPFIPLWMPGFDAVPPPPSMNVR